MYLKRIELNGFKSFANKTTIEFPEQKQGKHVITSVVGPNGSGKSNVSDAIRWVLGEQSLKQLRGKKSQDIIFSGSSTKGQLGMAGVSLVFDNSDNKIPVDYDEVVIARKIYRSGENEYTLNGKKIQLLDFKLLLAKAQFGNNSYGIIGQGVIDRFLFQTPAERKLFFDEASGIKEFQIRRHQAGLRLRRTKENIEQAELLLSEVAPRLKILSRQVKKLEKRQSIEIELNDLQERYYAGLWNQNKKRMDLLQGLRIEIENQYKKIAEDLVGIQTELAELARSESRGESFELLQKEYQDLLNEKNVLESERSKLSGQMQMEYGKAGQGQVGWLNTKIDQLKNSQKNLEVKKEKLQKILEKAQNEFDEADTNVTQKEKKVLELQEKLNKLSSQSNNFNFGQALPTVSFILNNKNKFGKVYGTVSQLGEVDDKYALALDVAAGGNLSSIVVADDVIAKKCIAFLRNERLGIATFLPLNKIQGREIYDDQYKYLDYEGVIGFAYEMIQFEDKFDDVFSFVFSNTLIVETIDDARNIGIGKIKMVTLEGDVLERSGSMRGGYRHKKGGPFSFLGNASLSSINAGLDYSKLKSEFEQAKEEFLAEKELLSALRSKIQVEENNLNIVLQNEKEIIRELSSLEQELKLSTTGELDYGKLIEELKAKKAEYDISIIELEKKIAETNTKIEKFNELEEQKKKKIFALQDLMQEKQKELNILIEQKNAKDVEIAKLETKQEDLEHEVKVETGNSVEFILKKGVEEMGGSEFEDAEKELQKLKYKLSLIGGIDDGVREEYESVNEKHGSLNDKIEDLRKAVSDLDKLITELDGLMKKKRNKMFKEIKKEFSRYFKMLFGGGYAGLVEIYGRESENDNEDDEVEVETTNGKRILVGIDINACPPGKKIKNIQSLSGGERTMTSIALVCAILRVNPSPFIVLDEVEAALDEANSIRFTEILKELSTRAQCILITHNRATMNVSDLLYGVTMGGDGISRLVSINFEDVVKS